VSAASAVGPAGWLDVQVADLARTVGALADREEIRERLFIYADLLDTGRYCEIAAEVFTEDAVNYHLPLTGEQGILRGHAQLGAYFATRMPQFSGTQHLLANVVIEVAGDDAHSQVYALATHWLDDPHGCVLLAAVRYIDTWTRTPAGWRICERHVRSGGSHGQVFGTGDPPPLTPLVRAGRAEDDRRHDTAVPHDIETRGMEPTWDR
jgi:hypothetical protein